jgi:hypothetical protein
VAIGAWFKVVASGAFFLIFFFFLVWCVGFSDYEGQRRNQGGDICAQASKKNMNNNKF